MPCVIWIHMMMNTKMDMKMNTTVTTIMEMKMNMKIDARMIYEDGDDYDDDNDNDDCDDNYHVSSERALIGYLSSLSYSNNLNTLIDSEFRPMNRPPNIGALLFHTLKPPVHLIARATPNIYANSIVQVP